MGIGRATCMMLAKEGAKVAITDLRDSDGRQLAKQIGDAGGAAMYWHLDVARENEVKSVFAQIREQFGRIDVLVNNAGIAGINKPTDEITEAEWDRVIAINVKGVFFCTKHVIPYLRQSGGGSIINLSSIYGIIGAPDIPPYHASKGAVREMTKTDALLYAKEKIRVTSYIQVSFGHRWSKILASSHPKVSMRSENTWTAFIPSVTLASLTILPTEFFISPRTSRSLSPAANWSSTVVI